MENCNIEYLIVNNNPDIEVELVLKSCTINRINFYGTELICTSKIYCSTRSGTLLQIPYSYSNKFNIHEHISKNYSVGITYR
jgi:hypothetical protein